MKTKTQTFVIALAMMITLTIGSSVIFGQNQSEKRLIDTRTEVSNDALVGVWETVTPATVDCQTGLPFPDAPIIRVLYNFNQGGTMSEENTDPIEGPYRTTGHGIWKHVSGRNYTAVYLHYSFLPDKTHIFTIKVRTNITLGSFSPNSNTFTENGTFEVLDPNDNDKVVFTGCFKDRATRLRF